MDAKSKTMPAANADNSGEVNAAAQNDDEQQESSGQEICVPINSLAMPDDTEQMQPPEVGDPVSVTIEGKVTRINGEMAYMTAETANGQEIPPEDESSEQEPDEGQQLEAMYKEGQ